VGYPDDIVRTLRSLPLALVALLAAVLVSGSSLAADLEVRVLDVGQGDAIFIRSPAGKTVLVDAGPPDAARRLTARLKELVHGQIDLVLMTHPHADHIGGMEQIIRELGARIFMEPGYDHPSPLYAKVLKAVESNNVQLKVGKAGNNVDLGGGAVMHLLAPDAQLFSSTRSDSNANSIVVRLTYGKTAFYLAADSEAETEKRILASGEELGSDVYKVAHHGSRYSSTAELLEKIHPRIAVISVGAGNDYGHPTRQAIDRLEGVKAEVVRTDLDGEVALRSDGEKVTYTTAKGGGSPRADEARLAAATPVAQPAAAAAMEPAPAPAPEAEEADPSSSSQRRAKKPSSPSKAPSTPSKAKTIEVSPEVHTGDAEAAAAPAQSAGGFVASKKGEAFHRADCRSVSRIKPENLVRYQTREEAMASKRPAKDCNP